MRQHGQSAKTAPVLQPNSHFHVCITYKHKFPNGRAHNVKRRLLTSFCRAMLCKRGLCRQACLSVSVSICLSVAFVDSVERKKYIFRIFLESGQQRSSRFLIPSVLPTGSPLTGASNEGGVDRNRDSEPSGTIACCERLERQLTACAIHSAAHGPCELMTLVAGKRRSVDGRRRRQSVYDKKPQCYAKDNSI